MSNSTGVILITSSYPGKDDTHANADKVIEEVRACNKGQELTEVSTLADVGMIMWGDIFMGQIASLDKESLFSSICSVDWEDPDDVQLMLRGEEDNVFEIHTINSMKKHLGLTDAKPECPEFNAKNIRVLKKEDIDMRASGLREIAMEQLSRHHSFVDSLVERAISHEMKDREWSLEGVRGLCRADRYPAKTEFFFKGKLMFEVSNPDMHLVEPKNPTDTEKLNCDYQCKLYFEDGK